MSAPAVIARPSTGSECDVATTAAAVDAATGQRHRRAVADFIELTKPRVVTMVLVTTLVGFYLGSSGTPDWWLLGAHCWYRGVRRSWKKHTMLANTARAALPK